MDDKYLMESLLMTTKGVCDLYLHGSIESNTQEVRQVFVKGLNEVLRMQNDIYSIMASKGWYPTTKAPEQQINQAKQKFAGK